MIAAIPSLAGALSSATSMRGLREEIPAVRTVFMTRGTFEGNRVDLSISKRQRSNVAQRLQAGADGGLKRENARR